MSDTHSSSAAADAPPEAASGGAVRGWLQLLAILALLALAVFVNMWMTGSAERKPLIKAPEARLPFVELAVAQPYTGMLRVHANGTVEPAAYVNISPQVSGRVSKVMVPVQPGAVFQPGQTLFAIEASDYEMEVNRLRADLSAAQANLQTEQAEAEAARAEWEQFGQGEINELAARKPQLRAAEAKIAQIQAAMARAELNVQRTRYSLPFGGRVAEGAVVKGQLLTANQPYGRVYDYAGLEVRVGLSDDDLQKMGGSAIVGTPVTVTSGHSGKGQEYGATVSRLAAEVDRSTRMRTVYVRFDGGTAVQDLPPPGTFVDAVFVRPMQQQAVVLPASTLQDGSGRLWLVDADGVLQAGAGAEVVQFAGNQVVVRGVQPGQLVVDGSLPEATAGMKVRSRQQTTGQAEAEQAEVEQAEAEQEGSLKQLSGEDEATAEGYRQPAATTQEAASGE